MDKIEFAANTNSYITDYIKFADIKAGTLLTLSSVLAAGLGRFSLSIFDALKARDSCCCWVIAIAIVIVLWVAVSLLGTLWKSLSALRPNLPTAKDSLHSFPDIAARSCENYTQSSKKLNSEDEIVSHFCAHNWTLSHIADVKFKKLQSAVPFLGSAILAAFFLAGFYFFIKLQT